MIYDYNTRNESFLDVHKALLLQYVKNNNFMLQLDNQDLLGIDPFDPNLSDDVKGLIAVECVNNFWYFIREVLRWPMSDGNLVPTQLDMGNAAMYWNTLNGVSSWRTNIRQTCSDLSVNTILLWNVVSKMMSTKIISKDTQTTRVNMEKIMELSELSPIDLASIIEPIFYDIGCKQMALIRNHMIDSDIAGLPTPKTEEDATHLLRGNASDIIFFHMSEFMPNLETVLKNRAPVMNVENEKRINIFNSSYGDPKDPTVIFAQNYIEGMIKWKDDFYDLDVKSYASDISKYGNGVVYIKNNYKELGYSDEWAATLQRMLGEDSFNKEILLRRV